MSPAPETGYRVECKPGMVPSLWSLCASGGDSSPASKHTNGCATVNSIREKRIQDFEIESSPVVREGLSEEVTFQPRLEGMKSFQPANSRERASLAKGTADSKS